MPKINAIVATGSPAYLLTIVEVDRDERVQCQAEGCGHPVYKHIYVVLVGSKFKVLGSQCYQRLYGHINETSATPVYGSGTGKLLTAAERLVLVENTARFIEALEAERLELEHIAALAAERLELERLETQRAVRRQQQESEHAARQTDQGKYHLQPRHSPNELVYQFYDGGEMLNWRWRSSEVLAISLAAYKSAPSSGPYHASVMKCFRILNRPTPYLFALDVEVREHLPKRYIFRVLDELGLIERM